MKINGETHHLWRAVDHEGAVRIMADLRNDQTVLTVEAEGKTAVFCAVRRSGRSVRRLKSQRGTVRAKSVDAGRVTKCCYLIGKF